MSNDRCTVSSLLTTFDMQCDVEMCLMVHLIGVFTACRWPGRLVCASWVWQHRQHIWGERCFFKIWICSQVLTSTPSQYITRPQFTLLMLDSFALILFSPNISHRKASHHSAMSLPSPADYLQMRICDPLHSWSGLIILKLLWTISDHAFTWSVWHKIIEPCSLSTVIIIGIWHPHTSSGSPLMAEVEIM